MTNIKFKFILS